MLAAACLAGAIASTVTYVSEIRLQSAAAGAKNLHDCPRILPDIRGSDTPLNPSPRRDLAFAGCLLETGHGRHADRVMVAAAAAQPRNVEVWFTLAIWQASRRHRAAARSAYAHALTLDPHLARPAR